MGTLVRATAEAIFVVEDVATIHFETIRPTLGEGVAKAKSDGVAPGMVLPDPPIQHPER